MKKSLHLILILFLLACEDDDGETRLIINHYQQPATLLTDYFIYVSQEGTQIGTDQWDYYSPDILSFEYEWGYVYDLKVKKKNLDNPPQDASSIQTSLVKVVSREKVSPDVLFEVRLSLAYDDNTFLRYAHGNKVSGFMLLNEVPIDCGDLCNDLSEALDAKESLVGIFTHTNNGIRLMVLKKK